MAVQLPSHHWGIRTIAAYERIEQIGEGTYGQVYRARNKHTDQIVAMKKIRVRDESQGLPVTAIREIKILKQLTHPHMVRLKEIVTSKGREDLDDDDEMEQGPWGNLFLVLEYAEHDLSGLLDAQYQFSELAIKSIMKQLLDVLRYIHDNKFIHRDIKASNLLLNNHHELKLADFGLARSIAYDDRPDGRQDLTNKVITLWYRPPELLLGETRYGPPVDMWSVGCILVELLIGKPLFYGKTELEQVDMVFRLVGSPTPTSWPGHESLPAFKHVCPAMFYPPRLKEVLTGRMPNDALDLLTRLLTLDPNRRASAKKAIMSPYFFNPPVPPSDPKELGNLKLEAGLSYHEYQTKKIRRAARAAREALVAQQHLQHQHYLHQQQQQQQQLQQHQQQQHQQHQQQQQLQLLLQRPIPLDPPHSSEFREAPPPGMEEGQDPESLTSPPPRKSRWAPAPVLTPSASPQGAHPFPPPPAGPVPPRPPGSEGGRPLLASPTMSHQPPPPRLPPPGAGPPAHFRHPPPPKPPGSNSDGKPQKKVDDPRLWPPKRVEGRAPRGPWGNPRPEGRGPPPPRPPPPHFRPPPPGGRPPPPVPPAAVRHHPRPRDHPPPPRSQHFQPPPPPTESRNSGQPTDGSRRGGNHSDDFRSSSSESERRGGNHGQSGFTHSPSPSRSSAKRPRDPRRGGRSGRGYSHPRDRGDDADSRSSHHFNRHQHSGQPSKSYDANRSLPSGKGELRLARPPPPQQYWNDKESEGGRSAPSRLDRESRGSEFHPPWPDQHLRKEDRFHRSSLKRGRSSSPPSHYNRDEKRHYNSRGVHNRSSLPGNRETKYHHRRPKDR